MSEHRRELAERPAAQETSVPLVTSWIIEAASQALVLACQSCGLSSNAARPSITTVVPQGDPPAELTFPSYFCPDSSRWLAVLATLHSTGAVFAISMRQTLIGDREADLTHTRIYPKIDPAVLPLFQSFAPLQAQRAVDLGERVERAFAFLRGQALEPKDVTPKR